MIARISALLVVECSFVHPTQAQSPSAVMGATHEFLYSIPSDPGSGDFRVYASGDLDLDGWDDLVIGQPEFNQAAGRIRTFSGASGAQLWETLGTQSIGSTGLPPGEGMGNAIATLDWDGDGLLDVAGSAPNYSVSIPWPGTAAGRIRVVRGYDGYLLAEITPPASVQALSAGGYVLGFGASMGSGGDLTGDGVPDLVVSASQFFPAPGVDAGVVIGIEVPSGQPVTVIPGTHHWESI